MVGDHFVFHVIDKQLIIHTTNKYNASDTYYVWSYNWEAIHSSQIQWFLQLNDL